MSTRIYAERPRKPQTSSTPPVRAGVIQRKSLHNRPITAIPSSVEETLRKTGQPLDLLTKRRAEQELGIDFNRVRVHTDAEAAGSARAIGARAYNVGSHIVFGSDQYAPATESGRALLIHELAHVMQRPLSEPIPAGTLQLGAPDSPQERQAEHLARDRLHGTRPDNRINANQLPAGVIARAAPGPEAPEEESRLDMGVSAGVLSQYDNEFKGKSGEKFKLMVEIAATKVNINPGLLAVNLLAETGRIVYQQDPSEPISSYTIGVDDYFENRRDIRYKVPAAREIDPRFWPKTPPTQPNERTRKVSTVYFRGDQAVLANAIYLKYGEIRARQALAKGNVDFDQLPVEICFSLTRIAVNPGPLGLYHYTSKLIAGRDILARAGKETQDKRIPQRMATLHAAQAIYLSQKIFGITP